MWPPYDLQLIRRAKDRGAIVVAERINCMGGMVRKVLEPAFARRGQGMPKGWSTKEAIEEERLQMSECDYITAPNACVAQSIREAGIAQNRILETSYGYDPVRLSKAIGIRRPARPPVFAFVGLGIVRKGLDVLLEAWEQARIDGKLLIAGQIDADLRHEYSRTLARSDVEALGYVNDISSVYAAADVFVFPTHEEGGPQVTYEAAACGLPMIVSPMGVARIVRDHESGLVIDPLSVGSVADAISTMADDRELRRTLGENAARLARKFTWSKVGYRLCNLFQGISERQAGVTKAAKSAPS
jgi:glycosyltransferase involved in cell wall biosynthesis